MQLLHTQAFLSWMRITVIIVPSGNKSYIVSQVIVWSLLKYHNIIIVFCVFDTFDVSYDRDPIGSKNWISWCLVETGNKSSSKQMLTQFDSVKINCLSKFSYFSKKYFVSWIPFAKPIRKTFSVAVKKPRYESLLVCHVWYGCRINVIVVSRRSYQTCEKILVCRRSRVPAAAPCPRPPCPCWGGTASSHARGRTAPQSHSAPT